MFRLTFAAVCLASSAAASFTPGMECPEYDRQPNFDTKGYLGTWYEVKTDRTIWYDIGAECTTANYQLNLDGSIQVYNRSRHSRNGKYGTITGKAVESQVTGPGGLVVDFFAEPDRTKEANYNVFDTDYNTYALFYNCEQRKIFGKSGAYEYFSILARTPTLPDDLYEKLEAKTRATFPKYKYNIFVRNTTQGGDCEYDPEPHAQQFLN